jgi:hypothetical protein
VAFKDGSLFAAIDNVTQTSIQDACSSQTDNEAVKLAAVRYQ